MADRIHPLDSPSAEPMISTKSPEKTTPLVPEKPVPPPGTYVIQVPKDQIYRLPPPENAHRFKKYTSRKARQNRCCFCLGLFALLILLIASSTGVLYLVFRPKALNYSVEKLSIKGFNLTSSSDLTFSPEFDVTVRAKNPNKKIGIYYKKGSSVSVSHSNVNLCTGVLPVFYQPTKNVTVFQTALTGSGIRLTTAVHEALTEEQSRGEISLGLDIKVPVRLKVGSIKTWTFTVKVHCDIRVNKLTVESTIVSKKCDVDVKIWD